MDYVTPSHCQCLVALPEMREETLYLITLLIRVRGLGLTIAFRGGQVYVTGLLSVKMEILAKGIQSTAIFRGDK